MTANTRRQRIGLPTSISKASHAHWQPGHHLSRHQFFVRTWQLLQKTLGRVPHALVVAASILLGQTERQRSDGVVGSRVGALNQNFPQRTASREKKRSHPTTVVLPRDAFACVQPRSARSPLVCLEL